MKEWEWQLLEDKTKLDRLMIGGVEVHVGDRVRLRPRQGGDVLDIALAGQVAIIESIEQDYEGKSHVCVVLDDDPGRDLGMLRQPGHRFSLTLQKLILCRKMKRGSKMRRGERASWWRASEIFFSATTDLGSKW